MDQITQRNLEIVKNIVKDTNIGYEMVLYTPVLGFIWNKCIYIY